MDTQEFKHDICHTWQVWEYPQYSGDMDVCRSDQTTSRGLIKK